MRGRQIVWFGTVDQPVLVSSVAILVKISLRSPRKIFGIIIKKYVYWVKVSRNK